MTMRHLLVLAFGLLLATATFAQKKKSIIPRDSITDKYGYSAVSDTISADKEALRQRLEKWIKQNYNPEKSKFTRSAADGDTYTLHDREAIPGRARKYFEYDLVIDIKDQRYRYKLTKLEYIAVGQYPLEDKMATDDKDDLRAIDEICRRILKSLDAAMKSDW